MDGESDEKRALTGMFKSLDPNWSLEAIEAYANMIEQLSEDNFSKPLKKEVFRKIKEYYNIGDHPDIKKLLGEFCGDERSCAYKILQTAGYPASKNGVNTLRERLKQTKSQG